MSHLTQMVGLDGAELRLGRGRARGRGRADPRTRPPAHVDARQLLGRPRAHASPGSSCRPPSCSWVRCHGQPGRRAEPRTASPKATTVEGTAAADSGRADREPGVDQGARQQRRRALQRQLVASVREPQRRHQPPADVPASSCSRSRSTWTFGKMAKDRKQGIAVLGAMATSVHRDDLRRDDLRETTATRGSRPPGRAGRDATQGGGNMEGKETRFGSSRCGLYRASTTHTSTGAVNCLHDSMTPRRRDDADDAT